LGVLFPIDGNIKNVPNHQPYIYILWVIIYNYDNHRITQYMLQTLHQVYQVSMELVLLNHVALELGRLVTPQKKKGGTNMDTLW
jgi:hypothetical protein